MYFVDGEKFLALKQDLEGNLVKRHRFRASSVSGHVCLCSAGRNGGGGRRTGGHQFIPLRTNKSAGRASGLRCVGWVWGTAGRAMQITAFFVMLDSAFMVKLQLHWREPVCHM